MLFSIRSPNFITLGQGVQNFRGNPPEYDMNRGISLSDTQFFYMLSFNFCRESSDGFNSNLKNFFQTTHSYVVQEQSIMNEFCSNAGFPFLVHVVFQWEKRVINLSASSAFQELSPYKQNCSPHSAAPHEFTKVKICTLHHENKLSSVLLETSCYQDTLAMSHGT